MIEFLMVFFNDTATTEIFTLSLHDALPISMVALAGLVRVSLNRSVPSGVVSLVMSTGMFLTVWPGEKVRDPRGTRVNLSHVVISYVVVCFTIKVLAGDFPDEAVPGSQAHSG